MSHLIDLNVLIREPAEEYHAKASENLSSHQLLDFMRCPYLYFKKRNGLIRESESNAYLIGRAAHCRILEGRDVYESEFAVGGPINPSTGKPYGPTTKKFLEWQEEQSKPVLPFDKAELIENLASGVLSNDKARELLSEGRAEGVIRVEYQGFPSQIRIDWTNPHEGIVDLKTCDDLTYFEHDARRFGYHHQLAFYRAIMDRRIGEMVPVYIIAVEKKEPFRCGTWMLTSETLESAQREIDAAIERLRTARDRQHWPTGFEELRYLTLI